MTKIRANNLIEFEPGRMAVVAAVDNFRIYEIPFSSIYRRAMALKNDPCELDNQIHLILLESYFLD